MTFSPILAFHIVTGVVGFVSGAVAISFRKGSRRHGQAGSVFVLSMLSLAATGVYLAWVKHQPGNILGGALTFYLVATAWMTARRANARNGIFDWGALLVVAALTVVNAAFGFEAATSQSGLKYGYSAGPYLFLGSVALLAALGDVRLLARAGISGTPRIARHLWRMCFAWFIAASSIFLARQHLFPAFLRRSGALVFLSVLPLLLMIFWLLRIRITKAYERLITRRPVLQKSLHPRAHPVSGEGLT